LSKRSRSGDPRTQAIELRALSVQIVRRREAARYDRFDARHWHRTNKNAAFPKESGVLFDRDT
jgi:hypothetical protein